MVICIFCTNALTQTYNQKLCHWWVKIYVRINTEQLNFLKIKNSFFLRIYILHLLKKSNFLYLEEGGLNLKSTWLHEKGCGGTGILFSINRLQLKFCQALTCLTFFYFFQISLSQKCLWRYFPRHPILLKNSSGLRFCASV